MDQADLDDDDDEEDNVNMDDANNIDDNNNNNNKGKMKSSFRYKLYGSTPVTILQRFLELFTSTLSFPSNNRTGHQTKCVMSQAQQDKCLVYIFVLYIQSSFLMQSPKRQKNKSDDGDDDKSIVIHDIMPLLNELQLSDKINHGTLLLREAGCVVTRVSGSSSSSSQKRIKVELSVPLTFPKMKKKQRAK
jgi:hypothetical protein